MGKKFEIKGNDISDGYHTFTELYDHRIALFLALAKVSKWPAFYKCDYDSWFCLYLETPAGQISYHLPNIHLETVKQFAANGEGYVWDGHQSPQVIFRLLQAGKQ